MIDKKDLSYSEWQKIFTCTISDSVICAFQCDYCKKIFRKKDISSFDLPLKFPTLRYTYEAGFGTGESKLNFCSLDCLHELLKKVPFGFDVSTPVYFWYMNKRNDIFYKNWEVIE